MKQWKETLDFVSVLGIVLIILGVFFLFTSPILIFISLIQTIMEAVVLIVAGSVCMISGMVLMIQKEKTKRLSYAKDIDTDEIIRQLNEVKNTEKNLKKIDYSLNEATESFERVVPAITNFTNYNQKGFSELLSKIEKIQLTVDQQRGSEEGLSKNLSSTLEIIRDFIDTLKSEATKNKDNNQNNLIYNAIHKNLIDLLKHNGFIVYTPKEGTYLSDLKEGTYITLETKTTHEKDLDSTIAEVISVGLEFNSNRLKSKIAAYKYQEEEKINE